MPSTASELSMPTASASPPELAQPTPNEPARCSMWHSTGLRNCVDKRPYTSSIDMQPSTADTLWPIGARMAVILAAQGVIKKHPILSSGTPFFLANSRLASSAATSIGLLTSTMLSISSGKRTCISLTIAGHADEISGLGQSRTDNWRFIACDTISAARATSNTSSKPIWSSPASTRSMLGRFLNCPYSVGAGSAILYGKLFIADKGSVSATFA